MLCTNDVFNGLLMHDQGTLVTTARQIIQGMTSAMGDSSLRNLNLRPWPGVNIVERCAQLIEAPCSACHQSDCHRCEIAAELRTAEDRISRERDEEIEVLSLDDNMLEEILEKMVETLCVTHAAFKAVLMGEWHGRRSFLAPRPVTLTAN